MRRVASTSRCICRSVTRAPDCASTWRSSSETERPAAATWCSARLASARRPSSQRPSSASKLARPSEGVAEACPAAYCDCASARAAERTCGSSTASASAGKVRMERDCIRFEPNSELPAPASAGDFCLLQSPTHPLHRHARSGPSNEDGILWQGWQRSSQIVAY